MAKRLIVDNLMGFTFLEERGKEVGSDRVSEMFESLDEMTARRRLTGKSTLT
jgi:hypothetical protein